MTEAGCESGRQVLLSRSPAETRALGARLGVVAAPGDVFLLEGEFGAGKTVFVQGLASGLGVSTPVTSPSFVLVNQHLGRLMLYHVDLYRAERLSPELEETVAEAVQSGGVCAVEWPELLPAELREGAATLRFERVADDARRIELETDKPRLLQAAVSTSAHPFGELRAGSELVEGAPAAGADRAAGY